MNGVVALRFFKRTSPYVGLWVVSLGLRLWFFSGVEVTETLRADALHYATLASNLAKHGIYEDNSEPGLQADMRWPPGYPALLAPFFRGSDPAAGALAALRVQVVLGSLLPLLVVVLARRLLPAWAAWIPGLLTASCPALVTTSSFLTTESDFTVLWFVWLLLLARLLEQPTTRRALLGGLVAGFLPLVRTAAVGFGPVAAIYLAFRVGASDRRRIAVLFVTLALLPPAVWEVRNRIRVAEGASSDSYFARVLAEGIYPDLRYGNAPRGYPFLADLEFPEFSRSVSKTLAKLWERTKANPGPHLMWNFLGRWITLWEFHMIQSPPIHIYPVKQGLFRPAHLHPEGKGEPLRALYWIFRALYSYLVVPAVLFGVVLLWRRRTAPLTPAGHLHELLYLLLGYHVLLHSVIIPEPRLMLPMRPLLYLLAPLALWALLSGSARLWPSRNPSR